MRLLLAAVLTLQVFEQVVVNVNGDILTRRQLDERVRSVLAQEQGRAITAADMLTDPALRRQAADVTPRVAADAIDELLVVQRARELGLDVDDDDVDRVVARMRADNGVASDAAFEDLLRAQGIPADALRESVRRQILIEQVRQDVFRRITVSDRDAEAYYRAQPGEFRVGPAVVFREMLVMVPPMETTPASAAVTSAYDQALLRFVAGHRRVEKGEDFGAVARAVSEAPSRDAGGLVGPVDPQALPSGIRAALAKLSVGAVSVPVRTDEGYVLLKLESLAKPVPGTFDMFRERVLALILARKQAAAFADQLKQLRARALMDWKDLALKAAFEGLAVPGAPVQKGTRRRRPPLLQ